MKVLYKLKNLVRDTRGISTIELILILVVLIALVMLFKDQILSLVDMIFTEINGNVKKVY